MKEVAQSKTRTPNRYMLLRVVVPALALPLIIIAAPFGGYMGVADAASASTVTLCSQYQALPVTTGSGNYIVKNNNYAGQAECLSNANGRADFTVTSSSASNASPQAPAAYAEIFRGCHWGACTSNSGLPLQVSGLGNPSTSWNTTQDASGEWDVAYDIWFNDTPTASGQPNGAELMIWLNSKGTAAIPSGAPKVTIDGTRYYFIESLRTSGTVSWPLLSYKPVSSGTMSVSKLKISSFVQDSVARGYIQPAMYLISVEAGFEIWNGGIGLETNSFSLTP
jgi:Glycosyl hydrolase family 12